MRRFLTSVCFLFILYALQGEVTEAKSVVWNSAGLPELYYAWNLAPAYTTDTVPLTLSSARGWATGLYPGALTTVRYKTKLYNDETGEEVLDGDSVPVGTKVHVVRDVSTLSTDISWNGTGFSQDSPYGRWVNSAGPVSIACHDEDYVGTLSDFIRPYVLLNVNPPSVTVVSGAGNVSCEGDYCTVIGSGPVTVGMKFSDTNGRFYYRYNYKSIGKTIYWHGCHANNIPMSMTRLTARYAKTGYCGEDVPCPRMATYDLAIPSQTILFNLNATPVSGNPPVAPTVDGPTTGDPETAYSFTVKATDPDGDTLHYGIDWNSDGLVDEWAPSLGYTPSGNTETTVRDWGSVGSYSFQVLAEDSTGKRSGWTSHTISIVNPFSCVGGEPASAFMCAGDNVGLSADTSITLLDMPSCTATKCEYYCGPGYLNVSGFCVPTQCNDGADNDDPEDSLADLSDPGCDSVLDNDETDPPNISLSADPRVVKDGESSTVTWDLKGETNCNITENDSMLHPDVDTNGSEVRTIHARTIYTLTCPVGSRSTTVEIVPRGTET